MGVLGTRWIGNVVDVLIEDEKNSHSLDLWTFVPFSFINI
jgi:hypothetical protein